MKFDSLEANMTRKRVALGRAQTCTSHGLGECPNHLDGPLIS